MKETKIKIDYPIFMEYPLPIKHKFKDYFLETPCDQNKYIYLKPHRFIPKQSISMANQVKKDFKIGKKLIKRGDFIISIRKNMDESYLLIVSEKVFKNNFICIKDSKYKD